MLDFTVCLLVNIFIQCSSVYFTQNYEIVHEVHEQVYCVCQTESIWDEQTIRLIFKPTYTIFVISNRGCFFFCII